MQLDSVKDADVVSESLASRLFCAVITDLNDMNFNISIKSSLKLSPS